MIDTADPIRKAIMTLGWASGTASLSEKVYGGLGAILMLHRLGCGSGSALGVNRHLSMDPGFLDRMIPALSAEGYEFVSMDGVLARLDTPAAHRPRFVSITLDDGYRDNLEAGLPIFRKHQVPFTVYVAPGLVEGTAFLWWEVIEKLIATHERIKLPAGRGIQEVDCSTQAAKRRAYRRILCHFTEVIREEDQLPLLEEICALHGTQASILASRDIMGWDEIGRIAVDPLCTIGAHSVHHYHLRRLPPEKAFEEMARSAEILGEKLGRRPAHMAYPYGYHEAAGPREAAMAETIGFASAVTSRHGTIHPDHARHRYALPRISLNGRYQRMRYVRAMVSGFTTPLANCGQRVVTVA
jgi:peptidoglycan/xylan/chitin deacetylase (PgdA/CDA1 family)